MRALGLAVTGDAGVAAGPEVPPDAVFLLNPDTEVAPDTVARLLAYLRAHPRAGLVGPSLVYGDGSPQVSARRFPSLWVGLVESTPIGWGLPDLPATRAFRLEGRPPGLAGPVDWIGGAAILGRRAALEAAGGFDEGFFMYAEELDLCRRLRELGWETHIEPAARVVHHEARSSAQVPGRRHLLFHRSRLRYFRKHHGRAAAELLRLGLLAQYAGALALEAAKWLVGHKRELRRSRVRAYADLLASGLS
jgi:GT2 family glycosyltransferase